MHKFQVSATIAAVSLLFFCFSSAAQEKSHEWSHRLADAAKIPGAKRIGSETCTTCHAQVAGNFRHAFHAQQGVECEDCHGNGSLHVEGGGDVTKIVSFAKRPASAGNAVCLSCHSRDENVRHWASGSHAVNHVRCTECHQIHVRALKTANEGRMSFDTATRAAFLAGAVSPETNVKLRPRSVTNDACLKCHQTQNAQVSMPYHHPLREGKMSCVDCHDPHGGAGGNNLRTGNTNQLCLGCHAQYRGPFAYQHPPVTENCLSCHTAHGSPNTNLLNVSEPALCLQCHSGHHNGAGLPLPDRCTNCHGSIHGTDVPTPTGGSRFLDKGCSEVVLRTFSACPAPPLGSEAGRGRSMMSAAMMSTARLRQVHSAMPNYAAGAAGGMLAMLSSGNFPPFSAANMGAGNSAPAGPEEEGAASSFYSITPGAYRFIHGSGFLGRAGEYDSLEQSAGVDAVTAFVAPGSRVTVISRANVLSGNDYSAVSRVTAGEWLEAVLDVRSFVQQQDHYPFYAFPVLDVPNPGTPPVATNCLPSADCTTDLIPSQAVYGMTRRLGEASARIKVPNYPVHLFVKGNWEARAGVSQLTYLDENSFVPVPGFAQFCGAQCHFSSQFQQANYTTRNVSGGADIDLGQVRLTWEHAFSSFNDRLNFPTGTFTGAFLADSSSCEVSPFGFAGTQCPTSGNLPPAGPAPVGVAASPSGTGYTIDTPSSSRYSSDSLRLNWTASPKLTFNGNVSYTRMRNLFTRYLQNSFDTDDTLAWRPLDRLRATADYHQHNVINDFTPFYSLYGNVSYHNHWEGLRLEYELPKGFDVEGYYKRSGITRSNAALWDNTAYNLTGSQIYSVDNTDLLKVVPSSISNTAGLALRYHGGGNWSARAGYEWTGTHDPGYLIVPQSNNRAFANVWLTPAKWLVFSNDINIIAQNDFAPVPLPNTAGVTPLAAPGATATFGLNIAGLPPTFQRRNRFYTETASATLRPVAGWILGLGYSYQQNNLLTYMAFQNDSGTGYILDEPLVPYKQITQAYWAESTYTFGKRWGLDLRVTYNSSRSGMRPNVNPADAALLGNQFLQSAASPIAFNQTLFGTPGQPLCPPGAPTALCNVQLAATQISQVIVPQWIGESKAYYHFPYKVEGGFIFYYGSYRDYFNPNLNGVLRTYNVYVGRSW